MKKVLKTILYWAITLACIFGYYVAVSNGLTATPFFLQLRRFVPMALLIVLTVMLLQGRVKKGFWWSFVIVAFVWATIYPVHYWMDYHTTVPFFSTHHDIAFAGYSFIGCTLLAYLLQFVFRPLFAAIFISTLQWLMLLPCFVQAAYLWNYGAVITNPAILAIWQTTPSEAKEYLMMTGGYTGIIAIVVGVILMWVGLFLLNHWGMGERSEIKEDRDISVKSLIAMIVLCVLACGYGFTKGLRKTCIVEMCADVKQYFENSEAYRTNHDANFAKLVVQPNTPKFTEPSTIMVIIGESASRSFISAYNGKYPVNTSPWLKAQRTNPNFCFFEKVRACAGQTVPVLEKALTEKNLQNKLEFKDCVSIIDLARKAGYKTYWFSNQSRMDESATPITLVAETANVVDWTNVDSDSWQYDEQLLKSLQLVDESRNNFVVLHLIGSHAAFENRFPETFAKPGKTLTENYELSLQYTDANLQKFFEFAKEKLNLQAMLYFSDHGCVPKDKRRADETRDAHMEIPYVLYLGDEYRALYPGTVDRLQTKAHETFTNDLTYDIVQEMLNVTTTKQ